MYLYSSSAFSSSHVEYLQYVCTKGAFNFLAVTVQTKEAGKPLEEAINTWKEYGKKHKFLQLLIDKGVELIKAVYEGKLVDKEFEALIQACVKDELTTEKKI